jgi:non-specific protein-tyrosine kinase
VLNWPTLATVHLAKTSNKEEMINPSGRDINAESYRILRTNIGFASIDRPLHSLMVTSALPRAGKSVIAANLAIFMAKAGKHTLLIDADLHRPVQHTLFNLPADRMGLSNALLAFSLPGMSIPKASSDLQFQNPALQPLNSVTTDSLSLRPFVHAIGIPNLWVMPTGPLPPNPSELLDSKAMQRFLAAIANCGVEMVIFDTPPLLGLSDASILASKVDGVLVVVDMTCATKGKLKQLKATLAQTGVNVLGCVANKHRRSRNDPAYSYYYYQMDEQNGDEEQARNGQISPLPGAPVSPSPLEQGKKSNWESLT